MALLLEASDIEWVKGRLSSGGVSRTGLSVELCERKGWYDNKQRPRSMAARLVLGHLDRTRVISLPAPVFVCSRREIAMSWADEVARPHLNPHEWAN